MILAPGGAVQLSTLAEALRFAEAVVQSGLAPNKDTAAAVLIKIQAGAELGFPPMRSLASLVVVNGKLTLQGDAMLALIRSSGRGRVLVGVAGEGDARHGWCEIERFDTKEKDRLTFSMADAKKAGLLAKESAWKGYPDDMLKWKAVARAGKFYFSDVLAGMEPEEEARTYEPTPFVPVTVTAPQSRQLEAPAEADPLTVTPTAAVNVAPAEAMHGRLHEPGCAKREADAECNCRLREQPCGHEGLPSGLRDNLAAGEELTCTACGEVITGPGKNVVAKAEKAKGQGRL